MLGNFLKIDYIVICFLARLFFKEKKSRYCHHSGVVVVGVGGGVVVVVTNFNLGYNFLSVEATGA